ncbi:sulfurtransferase TusA [Aurantivibrio plasticivorans]
MSEKISKTIDATGLLCPEPLMMLHSGMREIDSGEVLELFATDPSTSRDVNKFCTYLGHTLVSEKAITPEQCEEKRLGEAGTDGTWCFQIRKV